MALLQIKAEKMTPKTEYKEGTYLAQIDSVETGTTQSGKMYYGFFDKNRKRRQNHRFI